MENFRKYIFDAFIENKEETNEIIRDFLDVSILEEYGLIHHCINVEDIIKNVDTFQNNNSPILILYKSRLLGTIEKKLGNCQILGLVYYKIKSMIKCNIIINLYGRWYEWKDFKYEFKEMIENGYIRGQLQIEDMIIEDKFHNWEPSLIDMMEKYFCFGYCKFDPNNLLHI